MEMVMAADEINLTYTLYDRMIYGGVMPVNQVLKLETFNELKAEHFLDRRELGVINIGGNYEEIFNTITNQRTPLFTM